MQYPFNDEEMVYDYKRRITEPRGNSITPMILKAARRLEISRAESRGLPPREDRRSEPSYDVKIGIKGKELFRVHDDHKC